MHGYDPDFLGTQVFIPLPGFRKGLRENVLCAEDFPDVNFQNQYYTRYINYSLSTNKEKRQPIVVAVNIDQSLVKRVPRRDWNIDPQVAQYQLDNSYFRHNVYDRGHMARRSSTAWGETEDEALAASDSTMFYSNACLQHERFNQDEWLELENWVKYLQEDSTNRITVFSGPIYTRRDGVKKIIGEPPAQIPTAFFKVVCFIDKKHKLATRGFIMAQDSAALTDKNAHKRNFDLGAYQVPVEMIEEETGLVFSSNLKVSDPFSLRIVEGISQAESSESPLIIRAIEGSIKSHGDDIKVSVHQGIGIVCAMVDPMGDDHKHEWVSIANFSPKDVDLAGWLLSDTKHKPQKLYGNIRTGETKKIERLYSPRSETGVVLSNTRGTIMLIGKEGDVVDRVSYSSRTKEIIEGVPVTFHVDGQICN